MSRPDLISPVYITPVSVVTSLNGPRYTGTGRTELPYSDLRPKPLSSRRRRFVCTIVGFVLLHLCTVLTLVLYMTARQPQRRSMGGKDCELCDLWCTSNCSQLRTNVGVAVTPIRAEDVDVAQGGKDKDLCCIERRDWLSNIYEDVQKLKSSSDNSGRKKIFDGIRLKDKWTEDDIHNWPRTSQSILQFDKKNKRFKATANGTFSVHSRIDFCKVTNNTMNKQKLTVRSLLKEVSNFVDDRAHLGQSKSTRNGTVIYTSTVNVIVELHDGDTLEFFTDPSEYAFPRILVVYQSKEE